MKLADLRPGMVVWVNQGFTGFIGWGLVLGFRQEGARTGGRKRQVTKVVVREPYEFDPGSDDDDEMTKRLMTLDEAAGYVANPYSAGPLAVAVPSSSIIRPFDTDPEKSTFAEFLPYQIEAQAISRAQTAKRRAEIDRLTAAEARIRKLVPGVQLHGVRWRISVEAAETIADALEQAAARR